MAFRYWRINKTTQIFLQTKVALTYKEGTAHLDRKYRTKYVGQVLKYCNYGIIGPTDAFPLYLNKDYPLIF